MIGHDIYSDALPAGILREVIDFHKRDGTSVGESTLYIIGMHVWCLNIHVLIFRLTHRLNRISD